jgi:serine phosphatase RsbU (regulator of sigma subunit)
MLGAMTWDAAVAPFDPGDHLLLYTDGISETLAGDDGRADERLGNAIARAPAGGPALLETILADVNSKLAGAAQPDDFTLLTASLQRPI